MTNNNVLKHALSQDEVILVKAKTRILRLYSKFKKKGGWRMVAERLSQRLPEGSSLNVSEVYRFVVHGKLPPKHLRRAVFLPKVLPSERRPYHKRPMPSLLELDQYFAEEKWK